MQVHAAGFDCHHQKEFYMYRPCGSGDYFLILIKSGRAFVTFGGEKMIAPPNSAILFRKGTAQIYGAAGAEYVNDWMHFELDEGEVERLDGIGIVFDTITPLCDSSEIFRSMKSICLEYYSQNKHRRLAMQSYFDLLTVKLVEQTRHSESEKENQHRKALYALRSEITLAPQRDWTIGAICKKLSLSRSYVQHMYKQFFGTSILEDVSECRIKRARDLLAATDMTVASIARECGYGSDVYFMRTFKSVMGITPTEFRSRSRILPGALPRPEGA